jgi:hypothetical protein
LLFSKIPLKTIARQRKSDHKILDPRCKFYFEYAQVCLLYEKQ